MTRTDLVNAVAQKAGPKKKDADATVSAVFDSIVAALAKGEEVKLAGFGSFAVRQRAPRTGRNLRTGEEILIPAAKATVFWPATTLKDAVARRQGG